MNCMGNGVRIRKTVSNMNVADRREMPRTCIIVVTYNSMPYLERLCSSIKENVDFGRDVVVFADNGSNDGTVGYLEASFSSFDQVRVIRNPENKGFGHANNMVMRTVRADYYLLLNPDTYLTNNIVEDVLSYYDERIAPGITGPYLTYPDGSYQTSAYSFFSPLKWILQDLHVKEPASRCYQRRLGKAVISSLSIVPMARPFITGLVASEQLGNLRLKEKVDWITGRLYADIPAAPSK